LEQRFPGNAGYSPFSTQGAGCIEFNFKFWDQLAILMKLIPPRYNRVTSSWNNIIMTA
jgi:hypothetical protein